MSWAAVRRIHRDRLDGKMVVLDLALAGHQVVQITRGRGSSVRNRLVLRLRGLRVNSRLLVDQHHGRTVADRTTTTAATTLDLPAAGSHLGSRLVVVVEVEVRRGSRTMRLRIEVEMVTALHKALRGRCMHRRHRHQAMMCRLRLRRAMCRRHRLRRRLEHAEVNKRARCSASVQSVLSAY